MTPLRPVLLFDVMETLVTEPFYEAMPNFFGMTLEELLAVKHPTSWREFETGSLTEEQFIGRFFADGRFVDRDALRRCMYDAYEWIDDMQALLGELCAGGYAIHALSNYPSWYEMIEAKLQLSRYLEWTFVSCLTGVRKPDVRAYRRAAESLGVSVGECLFVDDRTVNVEAAQAAGMDAIVMTDARQLRSELQVRQLI
ncbi:MAG: HAD family phosphatase [Planctomycetales bacterium]|nr:HAD family phosphatase [Planctomycetales bacterium]